MVRLLVEAAAEVARADAAGLSPLQAAEEPELLKVFDLPISVSISYW